MSIFGNNLILLAALWVCTTVAGAYVTFFRQPAELERVEKAQEVARLKQNEIATLLAEASESRERAEEAVSRWRARYKTIPKQLTSVEVVAYLNDLSSAGFENFDVSLKEVRNGADYGYHTFLVSGRGFYNSLYRFIWEIENNRMFYRIHDLNLEHIDLIKKDASTEAERMEVMVGFSMSVDALFASPEGISASDSLGTSFVYDEPFSGNSNLPPVPLDVLPAARPATNPFFPVILEQLPPNTHGLIDVENARLIAIVGGMAVFSDERGERKVGVGDDVYLGKIASIDGRKGIVTARLNKGGIIDELELKLHSEESYRQALGPIRLAPAQ